MCLRQSVSLKQQEPTPDVCQVTNSFISVKYGAANAHSSSLTSVGYGVLAIP